MLVSDETCLLQAGTGGTGHTTRISKHEGEATHSFSLRAVATAAGVVAVVALAAPAPEVAAAAPPVAGRRAVKPNDEANGEGAGKGDGRRTLLCCC
jgi:hypothetical protein